jgi:eukaryotic-like serine/threonine-protein kinase
VQDSDENDERVMTLARAALRVPAADRAEYLRGACQGAADLYSDVFQVVEWEERMGDFLRRPLIDFIDLEETPEPQKPLQPGQSISERFVILREVGQGGMGVVYEAFDRKRNQRIAIKCAQPGFGRLLSPELEGALKVRHPNICLVNEIHTTQTEFGELDFLTMEFLEGETLSARLAREGKLPPDDALEIARQLCAGLAAAHGNGILHRDLKAANVILSRREDGSLRAVITDFGLATEARVATELEGGTPCYMAPELWRGEKPSQASDIYALGVILYEINTGRQPFAVDEALESLRPAPQSPSTVSKDLDSRWDKAILQCLDPSPAARPAADKVLAVFDRRPLWKSPALAVAVLALVALLAGFQQPLMKLFKPADIRLAILPLEAAPDLQEAGNGVLEDVVERIKRSQSGGATLVVIPPSEVQGNNVQTPEQGAKVLHATHALRLNLHREGNEIVAEEALIELVHQQHVKDFSARYASSMTGDIPGAIAGALSAALHLRRSQIQDTIASAATEPYDRGLYFLRRDDNSFDEAIPLFQEASRRDPHSPLPLAGLAESRLMKYWATKDRVWIEQSRVALSAAEALNPDSVAVLLVAGRLEANQSHYEKALEYYRRIQELEPRNVEVLLRMAAVYDDLDMREEAIKRYQAAIDLAPGFYKAYEEFGIFFYYRGDYTKAAEQFAASIQRAPGAYDAYTNLGATQADLGAMDEAEKAFSASLAIKESSRALNGLGAIRAIQGRDAEAIDLFSRSLRLNPNEYICLMNLGDSSRRLGRTRDADSYYRAGMRIASAGLAENPRDGFLRVYVSYFAGRLGDLTRAEEEVQQALQLSPHDNRVLRRAVLTYEMLGKRELALDAARQVTARVLRELDRHPDLAALRRDPRFRDLVEKSRYGG